MSLTIRNLSAGYGKTPVLHGVSFTMPPGTVTALIGPNGTGKSTLLRAIFGMTQSDGELVFAGGDLKALSPRARTRDIGFMPQDSIPQATLSVLEVVLLGGVHSLGWIVRRSAVEAALDMLRRLNIASLAHRYVDELSGGQRQLVMFAQALIRNPSLLLLDEPTSALDLRHQLRLLELVSRIALENRITTLLATHDLTQAARFSDQVVMLNAGVVAAVGAPEKVLTAERIAAVYGVEAEVDLGRDGKLRVLPVRANRDSAGSHR